MSDRCVFCGRDVSDLSVHVCSSCTNKSQIKSLSDKLQEYRHKLTTAERHRMVHLERLGRLSWYHTIQCSCCELLIEVYTELVNVYTDVIYMLEYEIQHKAYKVLDGNATINQNMAQIKSKRKPKS